LGGAAWRRFGLLRRVKFFRLSNCLVNYTSLNPLTGQSGARPPHSKNELHPEYIIPSVFDKRVAKAVAHAVEEAAYANHVARRDRTAQDEL
jgi:hypothetical protein